MSKAWCSEFINVAPDGELLDVKPAAAPEDPYQEVITLLLDILQQHSLSSHHHLVVDAFISIAKTSGVKFALVIPKARSILFIRLLLIVMLFRFCRLFATSFGVPIPV